MTLMLPKREGNAAGLLDAIAEVASERKRILEAMKAALLRGDDAEALEKARELTGLPMKRTTISQP